MHGPIVIVWFGLLNAFGPPQDAEATSHETRAPHGGGEIMGFLAGMPLGGILGYHLGDALGMRIALAGTRMAIYSATRPARFAGAVLAVTGASMPALFTVAGTVLGAHAVSRAGRSLDRRYSQELLKRAGVLGSIEQLGGRSSTSPVDSASGR